MCARTVEYGGEIGGEKLGLNWGILGDEGEKLGYSQTVPRFYSLPKFKNHKNI